MDTNLILITIGLFLGIIVYKMLTEKPEYEYSSDNLGYFTHFTFVTRNEGNILFHAILDKDCYLIVWIEDNQVYATKYDKDHVLDLITNGKWIIKRI